MRASPPLQIALHRFGAWRGAVLILETLGILALGAWLSGRQYLSLAEWVGVGSAIVSVICLAMSLSRVPAFGLRWDGRCWHMTRSGDAPVPGDLSVAIDLGPWLLLRFEPSRPQRRPRPTWLPVQRRGIEPQWHALRCAVYSPRPASGADSAADAAADF